MADRRWTLTVRNGPHVGRMRFMTLSEALTALEQQLDELAPQAKRDAIEIYRRHYDAARQVAVRAELAGPGSVFRGAPRGGVDLRGDGSTEAYIGRIRRSALPMAPGESAYDALARALEKQASR